MANTSSVFSKLLQWVPRNEFNEGVEKYEGDKGVRRFTCWSQFVALLFGQLTGHSSLRAVEAGLGGVSSKLYHLGIIHEIRRSTFSDANDRRDSRIFEEAFYRLLPKVEKLKPKHSKLKVKKGSVLALDATTIELCLSLSPWAQFYQGKGAVKLHTAIDVACDLPTVAVITEGRSADVIVGQKLMFAPGTILLMDRGYLNYKWWSELTLNSVWFVTRLKSHCTYKVRACTPTDRTQGIMADQTIKLVGKAAKKYKGCLRRISYREPATGKLFSFVTNRFDLAAKTICGLYKARWKVELFFKVMKQQLQVKKYVGNSVNAVKSQIWVALIAYLLMMAIKFMSRLGWGTPAIMAVFTVTLFANRDLESLWKRAPRERLKAPNLGQLALFNF